MSGGLLSRPTAAAAGLVLAGPRLLARGTAPAVGAAAGAVAGTARAGVRSADFALRVARVTRAALPGAPRDWRAGTRTHLALREATPEELRQAAGRAEHAAERAEKAGDAERTARQADGAYAADGADRAERASGADGAVGADVTDRAAGTAGADRDSRAEVADGADRAVGADMTDRAAGADVTDRAARADGAGRADVADRTGGAGRAAEADVTDRADGADVTDRAVGAVGADRASGVDGAARADVAGGTARADVADGTGPADGAEGPDRAAWAERAEGVDRAAADRADRAGGELVVEREPGGGEQPGAGARKHPRRTEHLARRVAAALAEHPDVAFAYWDQGLGRLVVAATEEAVSDRVVERAAALAERHGLVPADDDSVEELGHPGDPASVRTAAEALAADAVGAAAALVGSAMRLPPSPRLVTAVVTLLRENPRFRAWMRARLGNARMEVFFAVANAAVHGAGHTPTSLLLDGMLRTSQLAEAVVRTAAFETVHDQLCAPGRDSVPVDPSLRPPLRTSPAQEYAAHASTGSVLGAAAALLVKHDVAEAAEAVLAGSPKAARYGPAAFHAVLSGALSGAGVLVRDPGRLRQLEMAGTIVLHPSALRKPGAGADPWAEPVLDAARRAGLRVVVVDDPALADFTGLADQVVGADRPLREVVDELRDEGGVVTVARPRPHDDADVTSGLLGGDVAVALTDEDGQVVWGADVLAPHGLADVWRLLIAIPAERGVGRRSQTLARSGAALSGLLVAVGESSRRGRGAPLPGLRHAPVDIGAAAALFTGVRAALGVAVARAPHPRPRVAWHALHPDDVRDRLEQEAPPEPTPLAQATARARTAAGTVVRQPVLAPARWSWQLGQAVRGELDDPLTPVLAVGSAASAILGSAVDALLVLGALDLNALVGGVQRLRAERALSGLLAQQKQKARVTDDGDTARVVDAAKLSPGHVIDLKTDDVVPADARLLWEDGLEVDESALTGESLPVDKGMDATPRAPVAERNCMVFEGTTVVAGRAQAVVVDTGDRTEAARAVSLAARVPPSAGVQARLQELTRKAMPLTMAGGAAVTGLSLLRGTPIKQAVSGGVAVAVAAVPEGLPLVATVAQLAAARRLSSRGLLVRTPRTLEALGRMDTICFDKTGTLTENRLRLVRVADADGTVHTLDRPAAAETLRAAARACPRLNGDSVRPVHATDEAVLDAAGPDPDWEQTEGVPFEAARGYAAAVGRAADGTPVLVVKGAPETVLPTCADLPSHIFDRAQSLAGDGLRVLAVAGRPLREGEKATDVLEAPLQDLEFTGLLALADVARETSPALVRGLREAGVRPVVLTGDHPQTAHAIAVDLGWPDDANVVTGDELAAADRTVRARMLRDADVVARVAPEQKLQVVEALRDAGRVVGMVGDGANDAAAIRAADIGVGISARGSAAARNAADLVVTGDDLSVLIEAVHEGRALWHSVADAIAILIGGNAGEVGFGILGTVLSGSAPLSTRQMLLVNLFTDLFPAMAVAVTPKEDGGESTASDQPLGTALLGTPLIRQIRHRALTTCLGATVAWLFGRFTPGTTRRSTTMALCALVGTQLAQTLTDRRDSPLVRLTSLGSALVLFALVETPGASQLFGCTPLGPMAWAGVLAAIAVALAGQKALPTVEEALLKRWPSLADQLG
ncbi:HAD-IC family P-type ATPase [Streptomyces sp. V4I2]|uniref:HAD-IC family P-type ATPase n=1 Tax=Streptomyces sp. V4I2 TaxID=3042280 RepID=UPI00277E7AAF|nr:HAD-IC family P-type ATPase [Streptomyces sp. V4I2]MDQ1045382.1 cation-transporting ATPase I [Streptomyces sp. V4I2]